MMTQTDRLEKDTMQSVFIYVAGSCNAHTRIGSASVLTERGDEKKVQTFTYEDTTVNRCIINGLIDAVRQLETPHHVVLVTSTPVGVASALKGKGPNRDLVSELLRELTARQCSYHFNPRTGDGDGLNKYIADHQNTAPDKACT